MSKSELKINPKFEPLFHDVIDAPRYYQVFGGRGSGKSFTVSIAMVKLTYSEYGHKILYLRQSMSSSEDSTIADIMNAIQVLGVEKDFSVTKDLVRNKRTGSTITFKGIRSTGSQTAKLKSLSGITTLVIEEAEEVESFDEFSKVDESIRTAGKPLKIILIYNPTSAISSWLHKEWFVNGQPNPERFHDTMFMRTTYLDNIENLAPSTVQRYEDLERTNPIYFENTIMANWTLEAHGRIYDGWGHYDIFEEKGDTFYGMDFGYGAKDKTSLIKITYYEGAYYVEEMFSQAKLTMRKTVSMMRNCGVPFNANIYADSAMPLLIDEVRRGGFGNVRRATKGNVEAGIKKIQDKDIIIVGGDDTDLYKGYMTWRRDKKDNLPHEPDSLAAMRYGINSRKPIEKVGKVAPRRMRTKGFI